MRQTNLNRNKPCFSSSELCNVAGVNDGGPQQLQGERPVRETEFSLKINLKLDNKKLWTISEFLLIYANPVNLVFVWVPVPGIRR